MVRRGMLHGSAEGGLGDGSAPAPFSAQFLHDWRGAAEELATRGHDDIGGVRVHPCRSHLSWIDFGSGARSSRTLAVQIRVGARSFAAHATVPAIWVRRTI